ncbi:hypothetical protein AZI85_16015 [Bdellovibrio bacteriovorus]|uniref:O-antigen polymerase n=1 Tax=Bdellovibrio bacteriovorus TaxID=959 RepID=A0A150WTP0_BDEBC|nr:hypothetical protein [Bdellovibrio bacteriovorus]KYG69898.1 hypothetical protein AZI85_16015 [Bdellovibrio bacteriovorus]
MSERNLFFKKDIGFYAGIALATPFLASVLPSAVLYLSLLTLVPFCLFVLSKVRCADLRYFNFLIGAFSVLLLTYVFSLFTTGTPFVFEVVRGIVGALVLISVYLLGRTSPERNTAMYDGFTFALIPVTLILSILALIKMSLLMRGSEVPFMNMPYPQAASLKSDYNIFAFTMLFAALLALGKLIYGKNAKPKRLLYLLMFTLFAVCSIASGSRRILIMAPLVMGSFFAIGAIKNGRTKKTWKLLLTGASVLVVMLVVFKVTYFNVFMKYLLESMSVDNLLGFLSRVDRWAMGWDLISKQSWFKPMGFAYHKVFACHFNDCTIYDYPHLTIFSEWLVSGILGLILSVAIFCFIMRLIVKAGNLGVVTGVSFIAAAAVPHALISGDILVSNPQFLGVLLVLCSLCDQKDLELSFLRKNQ